MTTQQLQKVQDRLEICNNQNNSISGFCKINNLKLYEDEMGNVFISFVSESLVGDKDYEKFYLQYDEDGNETVLNRAGFNTEELENMFSKLKEIKL